MHTEEKENYNLGGGSPPHGQCEKGQPSDSGKRIQQGRPPTHQEPTSFDFVLRNTQVPFLRRFMSFPTKKRKMNIQVVDFHEFKDLLFPLLSDTQLAQRIC